MTHPRPALPEQPPTADEIEADRLRVYRELNKVLDNHKAAEVAGKAGVSKRTVENARAGKNTEFDSVLGLARAARLRLNVGVDEERLVRDGQDLHAVLETHRTVRALEDDLANRRAALARAQAELLELERQLGLLRADLDVEFEVLDRHRERLHQTLLSTLAAEAPLDPDSYQQRLGALQAQYPTPPPRSGTSTA